MGGMFRFRQFEVHQELCAMKVGTDSVLLGAWAAGGERVLDVGCGTGILALMLAQRFPHAVVTALDLAPDCCRQTRQNADRSPWGNRITTVCTPFQEFAACHGSSRFDAIVSNPPFFTETTRNPDPMRTMARHNDTLPFADLLGGVGVLLTADGVFSVIVPDTCCPTFVDEAQSAGLHLLHHVKVTTREGKPVKRHLLLFGKNRPLQTLIEARTLFVAGGVKSEWYDALTGDFYL